MLLFECKSEQATVHALQVIAPIRTLSLQLWFWFQSKYDWLLHAKTHIACGFYKPSVPACLWGFPCKRALMQCNIWCTFWSRMHSNRVCVSFHSSFIKHEYSELKHVFSCLQVDLHWIPSKMNQPSWRVPATFILEGIHWCSTLVTLNEGNWCHTAPASHKGNLSMYITNHWLLCHILQKASLKWCKMPARP